MDNRSEDTSTLHVNPVAVGGLFQRASSSENIKQNGRASSSSNDDQYRPQRSPSPRMRPNSESTTPTRTPTPTYPEGGGEGGRALVKAKSVSFHSYINWRKERKIRSAHDCLEYMIEGSSLVKLRANGRQYHRYFRLVEDLSAIIWTPTSKKTSRAQVPIDQIKEIRTGGNCESLRHRDFTSSYNDQKIFSILYGASYESLDLIAHSPEEANIWVTGLNALIGASQSPDTEEDPHTLRETWLRETFEKASRDSSGFIDQDTCVRLIKRLDNQVATVKVRQKLQEFDQNKTDGCRGRVSIEEFIDMFKEIATRPEIYFLMIRYANKDYLTCEDFHLFLEGEQGMLGLTEEKVLGMINKYEPAPDARKCGQILVDGFTKYLLSDECDIFDPLHRQVYQDMNQPLSHYFISTSHNTYLLEDQLKGPSSVDGFIRVLTCGCRCIKVDVYDGIGEPVVYHGNTLTTKILFREVVDAIGNYSFDYSIFPVFVHLENHCSVSQQKIMAELLTNILGKYLYVHPPDSKIRLWDVSPEDLKLKIIIMCKKIEEDVDSGEVSEEDEGGETRKSSLSKKIPMCKELSSLVSVARNKDLDFQPLTGNLRDNNNAIWSLSESTASKLIHTKPEEMVTHNKRQLTRVFPNSSRVDSSNYNPQDYWNAGCQMVALNFQTPGQMMDVYEGRFRGNGSCGFVLKPSVMREQISVFSANSKDTIPGVAPQILKIKVISGQCLPKPRGSSAVKASFIDPYVVIQIFGIPADCTEAKTRTVSNDGNSPVFDESFDFLINLPELSLIRFVVLDDEFIGDDFIGQCTIPFECIQTGYRHVRLLSSMGEPMDNATLFFHISISNKRGGKSQSSWGKKSHKHRHQMELKGTGLKAADDMFKEASPALSDAEQKQMSVESAWWDLQRECGLDHTANIKQCLKVVIKRFLSEPGNPSLSIVKENGIPFLRTSKSGPLPSHLHKLETAVEKLMLEIHHYIKEYDSLKTSLDSHLNPALKFYESLEQSLAQQSLKGKKANRARENFAYNVRVIRGQLDRLDSLDKKSKVAIEQVESTKSTLGSLNIRDRSPSVRADRPKLNLANRHHTTDNLNCYGSLGRSPTSPHPECKPKSILKKSNSNVESRSLGCLIYDSAPTILRAPVACTSSPNFVSDGIEAQYGTGNVGYADVDNPSSIDHNNGATRSFSYDSSPGSYGNKSYSGYEHSLQDLSSSGGSSSRKLANSAFASSSVETLKVNPTPCSGQGSQHVSRSRHSSSKDDIIYNSNFTTDSYHATTLASDQSTAL